MTVGTFAAGRLRDGGGSTRAADEPAGRHGSDAASRAAAMLPRRRRRIRAASRRLHDCEPCVSTGARGGGGGGGGGVESEGKSAESAAPPLDSSHRTGLCPIHAKRTPLMSTQLLMAPLSAYA